jgi:dienelactone hydrolase
VAVAVLSLALAVTSSAASLSTPTGRSSGISGTGADLTPIAPPAGASMPGTSEWYQAPAPDGHVVTLGVYRPGPVPAVDRSKVTVLLLNGGDGFRRLYETLAQRFADQGLIAVVGCWYEHPSNDRPDGIACTNGPTWKGMNSQSVADVDAVVTATARIPGVHDHRIVVVGQSYGGGVAMLRAAAGRPEPVVSASGFLARTPVLSPPRPTDEFAAESAGAIVPAVLVLHGVYDPITPIGQAEKFVAALPPSSNKTVIYYDRPASHGFPWQVEELANRPGAPMWQRYVDDIVAWIPTVWPTDPQVR